MRLVIIECDFCSDPVTYDCKCKVAEGLGKRFTSYLSKEGKVCECYTSEKGDISWKNGKAVISLLYNENDTCRSYHVVLKNLIREAFIEHNTACSFMESKALEAI